MALDGTPTPVDFRKPDLTAYETSDWWGDLVGDDLGKHVRAIYDAHWRFLQTNGYQRRWGRFTDYYYSNFLGHGGQSFPGLITMGDEDEYSFYGLNHLRSILKTTVATMTANPPSFDCNSSNTDIDSKKNAELFQTVMDYYLQTKGIRQAMNRAVEQAILTDAAYVLVEWKSAPGKTLDDGDLTTYNLSNWDIAFDAQTLEWGELPYLIALTWVPRQEVIARYPDKAAEIKTQATKQQWMQKNQAMNRRIRLSLSDQDGSDRVMVCKYFHAKVAYQPNGRFCEFLEDGTLLYEAPGGLPYPRIPCVRMTHDEDLDVLLGWSPANDLIPPQELLNELNSAVATNLTNTAVQAIAVPRGTDFNPRNVGKFFLLEYPAGSEPPQGLNFSKTAPEVYQFINETKQEMQLLQGVSNASRGVAGSQTSGSALLFQASQTVQNQSPANGNYERFASELATLMLHIFQAYANNERTIAIMGKSQEQRATFQGSDFELFDRVIATLGNPMTDTDQGKLAVANQLLQYSQITPTQFFEVLETGNLKVATEPMANELLYIGEENDALGQGQSIIPVGTDNHELHVAHHRELLNNIHARGPQATPQEKAMLQAVTSHIMAHMTLQSGNQQAQAVANQPGAPPAQLGPAMGGQQPREAGQTAEVAAINPARQVPNPNLPNMPNPPSGGGPRPN